jgi:hypothetical protein
MAYRNGTYIAFHAEGTTDPTASDLKYYRLLKAWHANDDVAFSFVNSHEKVAAVRDSSMKHTLRRSLIKRMNNSKNMILIIGNTTRMDTDWVPFEIQYAVDDCGIPVIIAYTGYDTVVNPSALKPLWPAALTERIANHSIRAIHIPFKRNAIDAAIKQFDFSNPPAGPLAWYSLDAHRSFGIAC